VSSHNSLENEIVSLILLLLLLLYYLQQIKWQSGSWIGLRAAKI